MKVTLADLKSYGVADAIGIATCDAKFLRVANEAIQRLLVGPQVWWNLLYKYRVSVTNGQIAWPPQIATILDVMKCGRGINIRDQHFEYIEAGYGAREADAYCGTTDLSDCKWDGQLFDRGMSPLFRDIDTTDGESFLKLYSHASEPATVAVRIHGYDWDGNLLRSSGVDGIPVTVPSGGGSVTTSQYIRQVTDIQKAVSSYPVTAKQMLAAAPFTETTVATWQAQETLPSYRRSYVGAICSDEDTVVTVLAKLEFKKAVSDTDFLMLGSLPAIKEMMQAVVQREADRFDEADRHEAKAFEILDREASHYIGSGTLSPVRLVGEGWGAGGVPTLY